MFHYPKSKSLSRKRGDIGGSSGGRLSLKVSGQATRPSTSHFDNVMNRARNRRHARIAALITTCHWCGKTALYRDWGPPQPNTPYKIWQYGACAAHRSDLMALHFKIRPAE